MSKEYRKYRDAMEYCRCLAVCLSPAKDPRPMGMICAMAVARVRNSVVIATGQSMQRICNMNSGWKFGPLMAAGDLHCR